MNIIYFDIDGTLRDENKGISDRSEYGFGECKRQGIKTVICTGRNQGSIQEDVMELNPDGIISGGGCCISYNRKIVQSTVFTVEMVRAFLKEGEKRKLGISAETKEKVYMNPASALIHRKMFAEKTRGLSEWEKKKIRERNHFLYEDNIQELQLREKTVHKICLIGEKNRIEQCMQSIERPFQMVQFISIGDNWLLECLPKGCSKGSAVTRLNQFLGIEKEDSMSFGDGDNDIDLLNATGIGIAMENGSSRLKQQADAVCGSVEADGIYWELVKRKMIKENEHDREKMVAGRSRISDLSEKFL